MKYLGFIFMFLLAVVLGSCSDKDVTYPMTPVDENAKAYVQINYVVPLSNVVANRIYKIDLNHQEYVNNSSALMSPYGQYPGGSVFFTVDAGNVEVKLYRNDSTVVYDQLVSLEGGKHYNVFVYDLNKAPAIIDRGEIPTFPVTDSTCTLSNVKLYNFLFEADGTPSTDKVQLVLRGVKSGQYDEPMGEKVGFGEATTFMQPYIVLSGNVDVGYSTRYFEFVVFDGQTGEEKGVLQYQKNASTMTDFTAYSTLYAGRSVKWVLRGIRTSSKLPVSVSSFALQ